MKKLFASLLALVMMLSMLAGCSAAPQAPASSTAAEAASSTTPPPAEGKVLNIHCWNSEFKSRVEAYYPAYNKDTEMIGDVKVNWVVTPNENNAYQNALDEALLAQGSAADDSKVDLFLIEADYALKYTAADAGVAMPLADLGITDADLADQFQYTKDVVSDGGVQRGISWQGCPGVMLYRRDIAKQVFGTDEPAEIQKLVGSWADFDKASETLAAAGYKMLAGYDDTYRVFSNNVSAPWVSADGTIAVDPAIENWVTQTMDYTQKGYNSKFKLWDAEWSANATGKTFSFFGPAWFIDFCLAGWTMETSADKGGKAEVGNGTWGQWAAVAGPQGYFWGGTWMCAAEGTDNKTLIADLMRVMCCNPETATKLAKDVNEFANNKTAMKALANDTTYGSAFLGGQNVYAAMYDSADKIVMDKATGYDQGLNESFQTAYHDYFNGTVDKDTAYANFLKSAKEKYPELKG